MAVDGSDLQITTDPSKTDSYAHNQYGIQRDECIKMEILARMIMYNFSSMITRQVKVDRSAAKHEYKANFALAIHICMEFFRGNALSS